MQQIQMTPAQWAGIEDNGIQRNTQEHAKKAKRNHLSKPSPTHAQVAAARLPDGSLIKLDGHTRSFLWQSGDLEAPETIYVTVYDLPSREAATVLYKHFDNASAAEQAQDRLSGAYRQHGVKPTSRILTHGGITSALSIIDSGKDVYDLVGTWCVELKALDELDLSARAMPAPLICAALLTLRKRGPAAGDFWKLYSAGGGTRVDGRSCGVDELCRIVADLRARGVLGSGGRQTRYNQVGRAISCCEAWLERRTYSTGAKPTDPTSYL